MQDMEITKKLRGWGSKVEKGLEKWLGHYIQASEDKPISLRRLLRETGQGILCGGAAFLLARGETVGGTHPFGLALLCAAGSRVTYLLIGLLLSSLTGGSSMLWGVTSALCFLLRYLIGRLLSGKRGKCFREPLPIRMVIAAAGGFTAGLYGIIGGGFQKSSLWDAFFLMAALPAAVYLLAGVTEGRPLSPHRQKAGQLTFLYALVLAMGSFSFFGFSPHVMTAFLLTLALASSGGSSAGCLAGLIGGLACGATYSPMLALCGLAAGTLKSRGLILPLLTAVGTGGVFSACTEGLGGMIFTLPSLLWGGALYLPAARLGLLTRLPVLGAEAPLPEDAAVAAVIGTRREEMTRARLTSLSEAMSSLAGVFYALSNRFATPGTHEVRRLCEDCFQSHCGSCRRNGVCWGQEYDRTADVLNKLAAAIAKRGTAKPEELPTDFRDRCPHAPKILSAIQLRHARLLEDAAKQNKTEVFALDYEALASLLTVATEEHAEDFRLDEEMTARARRAAAEMGMLWNNVAVFGSRRKTLVAGGVETAGLKLSADELRRRFSQACGVPLSLPEFRIENRYVTMTATSSPVIACESARASMRKENEAINGDSAVVFENREGYFYSLVSDGMGSGADAAVTSRITCIFLEKLLSAGNRKQTVLKMLNNFIRNKNLECFATVDLLEIDLLSGEASFVKSGAAASYILRGGKLFKLASSSLPIGITREMNAEEIRFTLRPGDLVVMISDGVSQSFEDSVWLLEHLSEHTDPSDSLSGIARRILDTAKEKNQRSDDMTVELVRIEQAPAA